MWWLLGLLMISPSSAHAGGRTQAVLPEIGFGGGVQDSRFGTMSLVKLDLSTGFEWVQHGGSYGVQIRLDRFWLPPEQDIYRLHLGALFYYDIRRPLRLPHLRVGVGPVVTRWERYHEPYGGVGLQAEVAAGIRKFVDWWLLGFYDNGDVTYSACVMTGIRVSTNLFRLIHSEKALRWR